MVAIANKASLITTATRSRLDEMLRPSGRGLFGERYAKYRFIDQLKRIECADGMTMSVQASRTHYCTPRDDIGPWREVEVGFPSVRVAEFMPYIDGKEDAPTDTVYGYVPIQIVADVIDAHGGFKPDDPPAAIWSPAQVCRDELQDDERSIEPIEIGLLKEACSHLANVAGIYQLSLQDPSDEVLTWMIARAKRISADMETSSRGAFRSVYVEVNGVEVCAIADSARFPNKETSK